MAFTKWTIRCAFACGIFAPVVQAQSLPLRPAGAVLNGFVVDEGGRSVEGAIVTLSRSFPLSAGPKAQPVVVSRRNGAFFFNRLTPGAYKVCAAVAGSDLLNPCDWSAKVPMANLAKGQLLPALRLVMARGQRLEVRLDDPSQLLAAKQGTAGADHIVVGVFGGATGFVDVPEIVADASGRVRSMFVPYDTELKLVLQSYTVDVIDDKGKTVTPDDIALKFKLKKGDRPKAYRFKVRKKA